MLEQSALWDPGFAVRQFGSACVSTIPLSDLEVILFSKSPLGLTLRNNVFLFSLYVFVCVTECMICTTCMEVPGGQARMSDPRELEFRAVGRHLM